MRPPIAPIPPRQSMYGIHPSVVKTRVSELPGMTSVTLRELFPDLPSVIYPGDEGIVAVRRRTEQALESVNMSRIKPEHSVNICSSHHGFTLLGGDPYAEMLKTIRDVIEERTGCENIRLRAGVGLRFRETEEYIRRYKLDEYFNGKARGVAPVDEGVADRDRNRRPLRNKKNLRRRLDSSCPQQRRARGPLSPYGGPGCKAFRHVSTPGSRPGLPTIRTSGLGPPISSPGRFSIHPSFRTNSPSPVF